MLRIRGTGMGLALGVLVLIAPSAAMSAEAMREPPRQYAYAAIGEDVRAPIGWIQFCQDYRSECKGARQEARDVVLSQTAWNDLVRVNRWVNEHIKPMTDMEHWGVVEKWDLPTDGYGDCEDYVLLKRKKLIDAGWPRSALLITVVRDKKGDGHAVLTVKTDKGEYVLDNQAEEVLPWTETGYRFVKRQSQSDEMAWVSLGDHRPAVATASSRRP
ncbi:MAG: transglutaminase [Xanthobacteraceae bacterium]|nr:MAG: transglutaminase [Xanthobacteraceae bacterium]